MTDNSIIALQTSAGFRGIHCFRQSSPTEISDILLKYYRKKKKIELMILGGNIVSLGRYLKPPKEGQCGSITQFFKRDRGVNYQDYFFVLFQSQLLSKHVNWIYVFLQNHTWVYCHKTDNEWKLINNET